MENMNVKVLGVKEWFSDKNNMVDYEVDTVIEVKEKAVKVSMTEYGITYFYWVPKSCLEIRNKITLNPSKYNNIEGKTLDEVIQMYKCKVSIDELIEINKSEFKEYC